MLLLIVLVMYVKSTTAYNNTFSVNIINITINVNLL